MSTPQARRTVTAAEYVAWNRPRMSYEWIRVAPEWIQAAAHDVAARGRVGRVNGDPGQAAYGLWVMMRHAARWTMAAWGASDPECPYSVAKHLAHRWGAACENYDSELWAKWVTGSEWTGRRFASLCAPHYGAEIARVLEIGPVPDHLDCIAKRLPILGVAS